MRGGAVRLAGAGQPPPSIDMLVCPQTLVAVASFRLSGGVISGSTQYP
jgi:hypothetical protein